MRCASLCLFAMQSMRGLQIVCILYSCSTRGDAFIIFMPILGRSDRPLARRIVSMRLPKACATNEKPSLRRFIVRAMAFLIRGHCGSFRGARTLWILLIDWSL